MTAGRILRRLGVEKLSDHVGFIGEVRGCKENQVFSATDVYLLPSDDENFGLSLEEALGHGVPAVVRTAVGAASLTEFPDAVKIKSPHASSAAEENLSWDAVAVGWRTVWIGSDEK